MIQEFCKVYQFNTSYTPAQPINKDTTILNLCTSFKNYVLNSDPKIWNNSHVKNPCERYFCGVNSSTFLIQSKNASLLSTQRDRALNAHYFLHTYCLLCNETFSQKFEENLKTQNCSGFDRSYCGNRCGGNSTCIYKDPSFNLCYVWDQDIFVHETNPTHFYLVPFYIKWMSIIYLILTLISSIFYFFAITIPDIYSLSSKMCDPNLQLYHNNVHLKRLKYIFSIENIIKTLIWINLIQTIVLCLLDSVDVIYNGRFRNVALVASLGFLLITFSLLSYEWFKAATYIKFQKISTRFNIISNIFLVLLLIWTMIGGCTYLLNTFIRDGFFYEYRSIPLGIWILFTFIFLFIFSVILFFYAIHILKILLDIKTTGKTIFEISAIAMNIKLTKYIIFIIIVYYFTLPSGIYNCVNFIFSARDLISNEFHILINFVTCLFFWFIQLVFILSKFNKNDLVSLLCCKKVEATDYRQLNQE